MSRIRLGKAYNKLKKGEKKKWKEKMGIASWKSKRYAALYREYSAHGTVYGKVLSLQQISQSGGSVRSGRKGVFHVAEEKLEAEILERRKVGDRVSGRWMRARMKELAVECANTEKERIKAAAFKASGRWLKDFALRWGLSWRKRTNKKCKSAIKRSLKVRNFHWFAIYKARLYPSKRSEEWKEMIKNGHPLTQ